MSLPKISILIPCYNAEHWISEAIESALAQTHPNTEVIVVDDGSRDGSVREIQKFEGRIQWETGANRGGNPTRNRLLELASGEWVQYLDADDYLLPDKLEKQLSWLEQKQEHVDVLYSPTLFRWEDKGTVEPTTIPAPHDPWSELISWTLPQTGGPLWRRQAILDVGGWKDRQPCCQEHELYSRLLMGGKRFMYCPETGAVYRQWSEGTVCKRNVPLVHEKKLEIIDAVQQWLRDHNELTQRREAAIYQAYFDTARSMWSYDRQKAVALDSRIPRSFEPSGPSAPRSFKLARRFLGLSGAEWIALQSRRVRQ